MDIVLGATGHIGSALVKKLVEDGNEVIGITSDKKHSSQIEKAGARAAVADVNDVDQLTRIFKEGNRLYLLNPPAPPNTDASAQERKNLNSILQAVRNASFEKIVAESTYGAQPGNNLGDLDVLYYLENEVRTIQPNTSVIRGAYYYRNWDMFLTTAQKDGKIYSLYPNGFKLPMVAPHDIAMLASRLLQSPASSEKAIFIEGPERYSPDDVATAFGNALQKKVTAIEIKPDKWREYLTQAGFSTEAAESMGNMTNVTLEERYDLPSNPERGTITLDNYIHQLVGESEPAEQH